MSTSVFDIVAIHTGATEEAWGGSTIFLARAWPVPAGTTVTLFAPPNNTILEQIFAGPAILDFDPGTIAANYQMQMLYRDEFGSNLVFVERTTAKDGAVRQTGEIFIPPNPITLEVTNTGAADGVVNVTLEYDLHRVG